MSISTDSPYDAASALSFSTFGHSTASPLATTRVSPAYLRTYDATGGWTATSTSGVGTGFTAMDDGAYNQGMECGTTYDALQPDSGNAASGQLLFSTSTWGGTCGAARATAVAAGQNCVVAGGDEETFTGDIAVFQNVISVVDSDRVFYQHAGSAWLATAANDMTPLASPAIASWAWTETANTFFYEMGASLLSWTMSQEAETDAFFTPPTASMTAFRGRGGFGTASGQYVTQRFVTLSTGINGAGHL